MREIKFRGKRLDNGEWVYGGSIIQFIDDGVITFYMPQLKEKCICVHDEADNIVSFETGTFYKVDPETVGQYTGKQDKNGQEVCDRDILQISDSYGDVICKDGVVMCSDHDQANVVCAGADENCRYDDLGNYESGSIEVIGNIYENPELLEVK